METNKEAEEKARHEFQASARAAACAPDFQKLMRLADTVRALQIPNLSTSTGRQIQDLIQSKTDEFAIWIENQANKLN